jgi:glycosyltransferase involved in cell wall biosynthesis
MITDTVPLVAAVPDLDTYHPHNGIGRVLYNLSLCWGARVQLVGARFETHKLPVLRASPLGVRVSDKTDLVLLPKLTGAQALRNTHGVPSAVIVHDIGIIDFPGDREGMNRLSYETVQRSFWGLRYASHIIADSCFTRDRILNYLPDLAEKISVVHNAVAPVFLNHERSKSESRDRIARLVGRPLGDPLLIYVGTEIPRKNISLLLRVLRRVQTGYPHVQLLKVGQSGGRRWRAATVAAAKELGLEIGKDILILENVDDNILADTYCAADAFLSTSLYEGFGFPALEAMTLGTPVVVSNRGSFPEIVGAAGWVVEPEVEEFTEAVLAALRDPLYEERAQQGREHAMTFSLSDSADRYLQVMGDLVAACSGERRL